MKARQPLGHTLMPGRLLQSTHLPWFALVVWALSMAGTLLLDDPRLRYGPFLALQLGATIGWGTILYCGTKHAPCRRFFRAVVVIGVCARLGAWFCPPAFSEDVFRTVYEGRVVWSKGPAFPFIHAPAFAPDHGVSSALFDESWLRINHPDIPTLYPPFAQFVFVLAAGIGDLLGGHHLQILKAFLLLAELITWLLLTRTLSKKHPRAAFSACCLFGLAPLTVLEIAREGHADSLSALGLAIGVLGFSLRKPSLGFVGFSTAALAKLNGLVALLAATRTTRRGIGYALVLLSFLTVPWLFAGTRASTGLFAYGQRWQAGDGVFSILVWAAESILRGDWHHIWGHTITKQMLARAMTGFLFVGYAWWLLKPNSPLERIPTRAGLLLLALLLLSPTLHPWYVLWILPFCALEAGTWTLDPRQSPAAILPYLLLVALAPLLHHPGWIELRQGVWSDMGSIRALVHVPVWVAFVFASVRARYGGKDMQPIDCGGAGKD